MPLFRRKQGRLPPVRGRAPPRYARWPLDAPLLRLPPRDALTLRDVLSGGIHIMGGTGSGKSSGPIATLIRAMIHQGWGMLFLCAKRDDAEAYIRAASLAEREEHIIRVTSTGAWRFNWISYELQRPDGGGEIQNIVSLLTSVLTEVVEGKQISSGYDFWDIAARMLLRNAISLLAAAKGTIRLEDLSLMLASVPRSLEQTQEAEWQRTSFCAQMIAQADQQPKSSVMQHEVTIASRYFLTELAAMGERTRSSVISTLSASVDLMQRGALYHLFGQDTTFVPEILDEGAIIILDMPIVQYQETARIAGMLLKLMCQRALLRRQRPERPVAIIVDEAQNYVSSFDWEFAAMSRSQRATSIYATQSLQNYASKLGYGADAAVKALLAQFQAQIFCRNNDVHTNQYAADLIARRWRTRMNSSSQNSLSGPSQGTSSSQSLEYPVQPGDFLHLRSGGPPHYAVDTMLVGARPWSHGDVYLPVTFYQK